MKKDFIFSSESVTEGYPDKLCDQISDAIVDHFLQHDPFSSVIAECAVSTAIVFIAARFSSSAHIDFSSVARNVINQVGYDKHDFSSKTCSIVTSLKELPTEDYRAFNERQMTEEELDLVPVKNQVTSFGFACNQTPAMMPYPIWLSHKLSRKLSSVRFQKILPYIAPDGKTQVAIEFKSGVPYRIYSITIVASQHQSEKHGGPTINRVRSDIRDAVIDVVFMGEELAPDADTHIFINPEGPFVTGGPSVHSGLTGRKNAIDTYGEFSRHSGAALSGKDPTRIDRVGAYAARYAAKNVVSAGLAGQCEVQLSYYIVLSKPVSIQVETFGTGRITDESIAQLIEKHFDFRVGGILRQFNLRYLPSQIKGGFFRKIAAYSHVGRMDIGLPWEQTDKAHLLAEEV